MWSNVRHVWKYDDTHLRVRVDYYDPDKYPWTVVQVPVRPLTPEEWKTLEVACYGVITDRDYIAFVTKNIGWKEQTNPFNCHFSLVAIDASRDDIEASARNRMESLSYLKGETFTPPPWLEDRDVVPHKVGISLLDKEAITEDDAKALETTLTAVWEK